MMPNKQIKTKKSFGRMCLSQAGFSLVEVLITLGIGTTTTLLLTSSLVNTIEMGRSSQTRQAIFMKVAELQGYLRNPHVIQQIIERNNLEPCTPVPAEGGGTARCNWEPTPISITDGGSSVDGGVEQVIYDATNPEVGLTNNGQVCNSYVSDPAMCPVRVNLAAQLECAGSSCLTMLLKVRGDLQTSPNYLFRHNFTGMSFSAFSTVEASSPPTEIQSMNSMVVVLLEDGTVKLWGTLSTGDQWADGSGTARYYQPTDLSWHDTGAPVDGIVDIAGGSTHMCGVYQESGQGRAFCFGRNMEGQLGNGTKNDNPSPQYAYRAVPVSLPGAVNVLKTVSGPAAGSGAIGLDGGVTKLFMWGNGRYGRFGSIGAPAIDSCMGNTSLCPEELAPVEATLVNNLVIANDLVLRDVALGEESACAIFDGAGYTGAVFCWGRNSNRQLGSPNAAAAPSLSFWIPAGPSLVANDLVEIETGGPVTGAKLIVESDGSYCVLLESGRVACWGANGGGHLSVGVSGSIQPAKFALESPGVPIESVKHISGRDRGYCLLLNSGEVRCAGATTNANYYSVLGRTTIPPHGFFDNANNALLALPRDLAQVSFGRFQACAMTLTANIYCWGNNAYRGLTDSYSSSYDSPDPVPISGL